MNTLGPCVFLAALAVLSFGSSRDLPAALSAMVTPAWDPRGTR